MNADRLDKANDRQRALEAYDRIKADADKFWRGKDGSDAELNQYTEDHVAIRAALSAPPEIEGLEEALSIDSGLRISADLRAIEQAARAYLELTKEG